MSDEQTEYEKTETLDELKARFAATVAGGSIGYATQLLKDGDNPSAANIIYSMGETLIGIAEELQEFPDTAGGWDDDDAHTG